MGEATLYTARHPATRKPLPHYNEAAHKPVSQPSKQPASACLHAVAQVPQQVLQRVEVPDAPPQGLCIEHRRVDVGQPPGARLAPQAAPPPRCLNQPAGVRGQQVQEQRGAERQVRWQTESHQLSFAAVKCQTALPSRPGKQGGAPVGVWILQPRALRAGLPLCRPHKGGAEGSQEELQQWAQLGRLGSCQEIEDGGARRPRGACSTKGSADAAKEC
jgi:hypothetical protein